MDFFSSPAAGITPQEAQRRRMELGRLGEDIACDYLLDHGFRLLERNWKSRYHYELDILAFKDMFLHVVEVKTRLAPVTDDPMIAITYSKLEKLRRGALLYKAHKGLNLDICIDGISIVLRTPTDYDVHFIPDLHMRLMIAGG